MKSVKQAWDSSGAFSGLHAPVVSLVSVHIGLESNDHPLKLRGGSSDVQAEGLGSKPTPETDHVRFPCQPHSQHPLQGTLKFLMSSQGSVPGTAFPLNGQGS